jgi:hypothetical protein
VPCFRTNGNRVIALPHGWSSSLHLSLSLFTFYYYFHIPSQCDLHHFGSWFSSQSLSVLISFSMASVKISPYGQFNDNSSNLPVDTFIFASAVTTPQSSQYHHLSFSPAQGGKATQEIAVHDLHGVDWPSPWSKINKDAIIITTVKMMPKKRLKCCLKVVHNVLFFWPSNMSVETRCIKDVPHMKPNIIPPKSLVVGKEWDRRRSVSISISISICVDDCEV